MFIYPFTRRGRKARATAKLLFAGIVERARQPVFYTDMQIPDTLDGRFDLISLHTGLVINRLRGEGTEGEILAQALFDEMFLTMEISCRQMGIGDLGVPKQIKKMMKAFKGRALTYQAASAESDIALQAMMARNLYATSEPPPPLIVLKIMAGYYLNNQRDFLQKPLESFQTGYVEFSPLPLLGE